ncbi:MAG: JAB domain-containing protein [Nitrososphaerota archaeon]
MKASELTKDNGYEGYKVKVMLVREGSKRYKRKKFNLSSDVYEFLRPSMENLDREHFVAIHLDIRNYVIGVEQISIGSVASTPVFPKEVLKGALLANAVGIIVAHNHPSGEIEPSNEDRLLTLKLKEACELIGINLVDHIIVGH